MKTPDTTSLPAPCAAWAPRLAALHPDDLPPEEQAALQAHIAGCPNCRAVYAAYQAIDAQILSLPAVQPSAQQVAQLRAKIDDQTRSAPRSKAPVIAQREPAVPAPTRWSRFGQRMSLLTAALILVVLVGGAFALFASRHAPHATTSATPSTGAGASGTIYAVSQNGFVFAVNVATGKTIWTTPLGIQTSEQFVVAGGKIFVGSSDYFLYALQASDGHILWQRSYADLTTVGNQTVQIAPYPASDGTAIYFGTPKGIYAWSAADGHQLWSYPAPATCSALSGVCAPEVAAVSNGTVYAYLDGLYALNASDGSLRWQNAKVPNNAPLALADNHIYVASYDGKTMAVLQADSGQLLDTPALAQISPVDLISDGSTVFLGTALSANSADVYAVRASDNTLLWHKQYAQEISFSNVDAGSLYYTYIEAVPYSQLTPVPGSSGPPQPQLAIHLCAVQATDGAAQWCRQLPNGTIAGQLAVVRQGTLYVTTLSGVEAIRLSDGRVLWTALNNVSLARIALN